MRRVLKTLLALLVLAGAAAAAGLWWVNAPLPIAAGRKTGQLTVELPPLKPGEYALKCRVFAADGHLTEEILRFSVTE